MRKGWTWSSAVVLVLTGCGAGNSPSAGGAFTLPANEVDQHDTAYIAEVVADPDGDDLADGSGEYVVVHNNWDLRADLGGWSIEDADGNELDLGVGRQLVSGARLRVYSSCGEDTDEAVHNCLDEPVLDDSGDVLVLRDSGGNEVMRFPYGTASE